MLRKSSKILFSLGVLVLCTSGAMIAIRNVGNWLVISDSVPAKLDVVFTFAGEGYRVNYSRELVNRFPGSHWVLSDYKNGYSRLLRKDGFTMDRVSIIDTCSSTQSEVDALRSWITDAKSTQAVPYLKTLEKIAEGKNSEVVRIGLVSSPYHMRRIKLMVNRSFPRSGHEFYLLPVPIERYPWPQGMFSKWWNNRSATTVVISELQKIAYFLLMG